MTDYILNKTKLFLYLCCSLDFAVKYSVCQQLESVLYVCVCRTSGHNIISSLCDRRLSKTILKNEPQRMIPLFLQKWK